MPSEPSKTLDTFPNPHPNADYEIDIEAPEFTSICPITGQPDFATIRINYVPGEACVELKSLKMYFWSYRNEGVFYENVTNIILNDIVKVCKPRRITVTGDFTVRGGIKTKVTARYQSPE